MARNTELRFDSSLMDHATGTVTAKVVLLEYSDYECPETARLHYIVQEVCDWLTGYICFAYRHFPDSHRHPNALLGAEVAEAAGAQGWFWEMHNLILECQHEHGKALTLDLLLALASHLPLNQEEFRSHIEDHRHRKRIESDIQQALRCNVQHAPTFFINGTRYSGPLEYDEMVTALNSVAGL